jgi:hypothetical protein
MLVLHCAAFYWLVGGAAGRAADVARGVDGGLGGGECLHQPDRVPSSCCYAPAKLDDLLRPRRGHEFDIDDHYGPILGADGGYRGDGYVLFGVHLCADPAGRGAVALPVEGPGGSQAVCRLD